jgi:hypothetical protein
LVVAVAVDLMLAEAEAAVTLDQVPQQYPQASLLFQWAKVAPEAQTTIHQE